MILAHKKLTRVFINRRNNFLNPDTTCPQTNNNILLVSEFDDALDANINFLNVEQIGSGSLIKNFEEHFTIKKTPAQIKLKMPLNVQNFALCLGSVFNEVMLTTSAITLNLKHKATSSSTPIINYYNNEGRFYNLLINNADDPQAYVFQNCVVEELNLIYNANDIPYIEVTFIAADYTVITKNFTELTVTPKNLMTNPNLIINNQTINYYSLIIKIKNNITPVVNNLNKVINFLRSPEITLNVKMPFSSIITLNDYLQKNAINFFIGNPFTFGFYDFIFENIIAAPALITQQPKKYENNYLTFDVNLKYAPNTSSDNYLTLYYQNPNFSVWSQYL